jgi:glycosyltransferase involved in cell wall biosynthesis
VQSALGQTWANREILIVDDASQDHSWEILQSLAKNYSELRIFRHADNRGFPGALNTLVSEARGEFMAFFDDDDESVPDRLLRQRERIISYEAVHGPLSVFCYSNRNVVSIAGSHRFQRYGIGRVPPEPSGAIVADYVLGLSKGDRIHCWGMFGSCTLMARTSTFRQLGGFDLQFRRCAELDFAIRAAFNGAHFVSVNAPLITQYLTETQDKAGEVDLNYRLLLLKKYKRYLESRGAYSGAVANMHAWFHHTKGRPYYGRCWRALALMLFPWRISREWLSQRGARS